MQAAVFHGDGLFAANVELNTPIANATGDVDAEFPLVELPEQFGRFMTGELVEPHMVC